MECERGSTYMLAGLNESPSEKEGKCGGRAPSPSLRAMPQ